MATQTILSPTLSLRLQSDSTPSSKLRLNISKHPKLSRTQAGHIRHFHNLASQLDGEWQLMGTQEPGQEWLDALRYQLATMAYASGVAHYHHLPALRSVFKQLLRKLIHKMLLRSVWGYWFMTSLSGTFVDPELKELRQPWADPVVRENIMYSGHLLLMISLYAMLFDDGEFEKPESMVFRWNPLFFGMGPETFSYDRQSLQEAILREMERNDWMGVCCEPNCVFVVCNQFPLIAVRYNDVRDGTNTIDPVLEKYKAAWDSRQMVASNGLYVDFWRIKQNKTVQPTAIGFTAWANAFMNSWNSEFVKSAYEKQALGFVGTNEAGHTVVNSTAMALAIRKLVNEGAGKPSDPELLKKARHEASLIPMPPRPYTTAEFAYVLLWLSEIGRATELQDLLKYADENYRPSWRDGGLYYPRNDGLMDPFSGNAAIGYARLNVADGQKKMWDQPWTKELLESRPWIDGLSLESGVDYLRGNWDEREQAMILTMRSWSGAEVIVNPVVKGLPKGSWGVYVDNNLTQETKFVQDGGDLALCVKVGAQEVDVVVIKLSI